MVSMILGAEIKIDARERDRRRVIYSGFCVRRTKNARRSMGQMPNVFVSTYTRIYVFHRHIKATDIIYRYSYSYN